MDDLSFNCAIDFSRKSKMIKTRKLNLEFLFKKCLTIE